MKKRDFFLIIFSALFCYSCNDNISDNAEILHAEPVEKTQTHNLLKFTSEDELQGFLDDIKDKKVKDLSSKNIIKTLEEKYNSPQLRAMTPERYNELEGFVSLLDYNTNNDLATLTPDDWRIINSDPDNLVYEPEDLIIHDTYLTSVLNPEREIQIGDFVYKYTMEGVYSVNVCDYALLQYIDYNTPSVRLDPRVTCLVPQSTLPPPSVPTNPTLAGTPLKLGNGETIPSSQIRDLNFSERGDANWATNLWTGFFGREIVAINKFSSSRKMLLTFYEQDYKIYKNIGTQAKMQKRVLGIWWNCDAQEIRLGWDAIQLQEEFNSSPFVASMRPTDFTPYLYPNTRDYEYATPSWMSKDFPFKKDYVFFSIPYTEYEEKIKTSYINKSYHILLSFVEKNVKAYMKAHNLANAPQDPGIIALPNNLSAKYVIGPNEDYNTKKGSLEKKFLAEWFAGTYILGYSTDPTSPNFNYKKLNATIKGSNTKLGLGSVYGAVKYDGKWLAARILKTTE